jgi:Glycosyl transferase family 2
MNQNLLGVCKHEAKRAVHGAKFALRRWRLRAYVSRRIIRVDSRPIPDDRHEVRLFMAARNESLRLPFVLDYYLSIGVDRIFVIDNDSSDATASIVASKANAHLFFTNDEYARQAYWIDFLLRGYGVGHWCLIVDADEVLVYPYSEDVSLPRLCQFLDRESSNAMDAVLLDMYPGAAIDSIEYKPGTNPLMVAPWFDTESYSTAMAGPLFLNQHNIVYEGPARVFGGVRQRVFGMRACISKFPLVKFDRPMFLSAGAHFIQHARASEIRGALLHFKYLNDFSENVRREAKREAHWQSAAEYKQYLNALNQSPDLNLHSSVSRRFTGSRQLVAMGIMKSRPDFDELGRSTGGSAGD